MGTCASLYNRSECSAVKPPAPPETMTDQFEIPPSPIKHFKLQNNTDSAIKDISVIPNHHKTPSGLILLSLFFMGFVLFSVSFFPPWHFFDCSVSFFSPWHSLTPLFSPFCYSNDEYLKI